MSGIKVIFLLFGVICALEHVSTFSFTTLSPEELQAYRAGVGGPTTIAPSLSPFRSTFTSFTNPLFTRLFQSQLASTANPLGYSTLNPLGISTASSLQEFPNLSQLGLTATPPSLQGYSTPSPLGVTANSLGYTATTPTPILASTASTVSPSPGISIQYRSKEVYLGRQGGLDESFLNNPFYLSNEQVEQMLHQLQQKFPKMAKVHFLGQSLEGRNMFSLEINSNAQNRPLLVPLFKFVGNMHGDEPVGRQLILYMAQYLLNNYGRDPEVTKLVDTTSIHLLPTMNPDGYVRSEEGRCESIPTYIGRSNAAGVDLNRDFPDRLDNKLTSQLKVRQPETLAMMEWIANNPFVLSANFHGGAVVASYPFDNSIYHHECCEDSPTPDDQTFRHLARTYAKYHPVMKNGRDCNETFQDGIVNGAYWYELSGGMQDYNYVFSNCFDLTLELSCCKFPPASELPNEWAKNKRSMLEYMKQTHIGIKGLVTDINGYPIRGAEVLVQGLEQKPIRTTDRGEYWRLLQPGSYNVQVIAFGYDPSEVKQTTYDPAQGPARLDFQMRPVSTNNDGISPYSNVYQNSYQNPDPNAFYFTLIKKK